MKTKVEVELSHAQEIALMERYGRKCSRETLVKRAIIEVLNQQAEDVPIFVTKKEHEEKLAAEAEAAKRDAEDAKPSPEVEDLLARFRNGEKLVDLKGRQVSALEPAENGNVEPLIAQFGGDDSEWYPVSPNEIKAEFAIT